MDRLEQMLLLAFNLSTKAVIVLLPGETDLRVGGTKLQNVQNKGNVKHIYM